MWRKAWPLGLMCAATLVVSADERPALPQPDVAEGFEQLMPRGGIVALVNPDFVSASEAEIPGDAWVLGFADGGEAYAYDLKLLNSHEIVNHKIGERNIAAVW